MPKISALPTESSPTMTDTLPLVDVETNTTKKSTLSTLASLLFTQTNIPVGGGSPVTRGSEQLFDHVASGGVWSGDSLGTNRNASMTALVCYINGRRITISAVTARTFTASKDTYIDVLDNQDGTGTLVYTEVTNNAASPALASNSIRIGIIITGAGNIANAGSINQGQEGKVLPISSSIPYMVTDSLGNLICPRDPLRRTLGYGQLTTNATATTPYGAINLQAVVNVPANRKIRIKGFCRSISSSAGAGTNNFLGIHESTTLLAESASTAYTANAATQCQPECETTPTTGVHTYLLKLKSDAGTGTLAADATYPAFIKVELV